MPDEVLLRHCAPTLAGIKTGNLFSYAYTSKDAVARELRERNLQLREKGLCLIPLKYLPNHRVLIYVYRPGMLSSDLSRPERASLLRECGYRSMKQDACIRTLIRHLNEGEDFPHEIGLFLGYPTEDVRGFMIHHGQNCKYTGTWKVYGSVEQSCAAFRRFERCTKVYCEAGRRGVSLQRLAVKKQETSASRG